METHRTDEPMPSPALASPVLPDSPAPPASPLVLPVPSSENLLTFDCEFQFDSGPPAFRCEEGHPGQMVTVTLPAQCSVYQLRLRICIQVQETSGHPEPLLVLDPEKSTLLYPRGREWVEAYDDCQVLRTLHIPWTHDQAGHRRTRILLKQAVALDSEQREEQQQLLTYLIGHNLEKETRDRLDELTFTRRKLASLRRQEVANRDPEAYATEPWVTYTPLPNELQEHTKRRLLVTLHYMDKISFSLKVEYNHTASGLLQMVYKVFEEQGVDFDRSDLLVLKVSGREEFFSGEHRLSDFLWVRHCMKTHTALHLSVLPWSCLPSDALDCEDWPPIDGFSGQFSSHDDLCLDKKDVDDIVMISLWDCKRKLRVKLLGFDLVALPEKCPPLVYVEAALLYGSKVRALVSSAPKAMAEEVLWNEWLEFDVLLSDLPRGAKLGLTINAVANDNTLTRQDVKSGSTREPKSAGKEAKSTLPPGVRTEMPKGNGKMLYFVNLLLIDHRSVLSQGSHTLHMWSCPTQTQDEAVTFGADKLSSATNPDLSGSVAISVCLDRYSFPVVLPNSSRTQNQQNQPLSSPDPSPVTPDPSPVTPDPSALASPCVPPRPPVGRPGLGHFREESMHYAWHLPEFLRKVNWMDRRAVEDVHWLLDHWGAPQDLDLTVALELLGLDFIDHRVRRLAVERLDCLNNDQVLTYLLQLVQSKRIGHFLFWYMRSEVLGCPYFRQRMAVILEAYLLGCGRGMLQCLRQQVQAVEALQNVALDIKQLFQKRDIDPQAPLRLREFLQNSDLPHEFVLPFDPRVKVGNVILEKCKVMASKKKPLWLEFKPMPSPVTSDPSTMTSDSSPTTPDPVGIIFKHGDDLRQDMLVIQTFVLMDSIWQDKSLDLNMIPYGCIATGHNIGMIETVRNAVTIAAIQKSRGGSAGAFKNDALFEWLKSKCPLQEIHFQTVETFVKSCAGYCVATYVLGIGDRHNDNIMITDKGNLFHIDFGHILGNWKRVLGVSLERVPFVLTPDFLYVMGRVKHKNSLYFDRFKVCRMPSRPPVCTCDICTQAYLSLRSQSRLLVTLFSIMMLTGMRELNSTHDMRYLREVLQEGRSEEEARRHFLEQIDVCVTDGWTVQTNWWIHILMGIK
ncbi:hypothetical protein NQD34_005111 [Periophthalmus magnuspinnatus]|nr:hypothetical protein NQD34_005111 [Periophthalmus magnuspinnatus]